MSKLVIVGTVAFDAIETPFGKTDKILGGAVTVEIFAYPEEIRKVIYTTNAIESLNSSIRKIIKHRRVFPNDEAATKLIYLAVQNISKKWTMPIQNWKAALNQFVILFEDRLPLS